MTYNDTFIRACYKQPTDYTPVWYMRQAGRYDPDYQKIKQKYTLLEICRQPELAAEVTMFPVHKLGVDAAILYSDIMNPVASLGIEFDIVKNVGPVIENPIRSRQDVQRLRPIDVEQDLGHVLETIRLLDHELNIPLIGFAGAPFTIASYLIEGRPSKNYLRTKQLMYAHPEIWQQLMDKLGEMVITYLKAQIQAGAKAVQVFDSWAGSLAPHDFRTYVQPTIEKIFTALTEEKGKPSIYFPGVSSGEILPYLQHLQADVISLDWKVSLSEGRRRLGPSFAIQGNMDPMMLMAPMNKIEQHAEQLIAEGNKEPGYIFNLGHGLFPEAPLDKLKQLTSFIHTSSRKMKMESRDQG